MCKILSNVGDTNVLLSFCQACEVERLMSIFLKKYLIYILLYYITQEDFVGV